MNSQTQQWITLMPLGLSCFFGLWAMGGTLWRGLRLLLFAWIACAIAQQHQALLEALGRHFLIRQMNASVITMAIDGSVPSLIFVTLIISFWLCWKPSPPKHANPPARLVGLSLGAAAGWLLGALILINLSNAGFVALDLQSDYGLALHQTRDWIHLAVLPLLP